MNLSILFFTLIYLVEWTAVVTGAAGGGVSGGGGVLRRGSSTSSSLPPSMAEVLDVAKHNVT